MIAPSWMNPARRHPAPGFIGRHRLLWARGAALAALGLVAAALASPAAGVHWFAAALPFALLAAVMLALLLDALLLEARAASTVVVVGCTPLAAWIASALGDGSRGRRFAPRPHVLGGCCTAADAAALVRGARCGLVVVATEGAAALPTLVDARGQRPAIVAGVSVLEDLIGRVPLDLAVDDPLLARLGALRSFGRPYLLAKRALDVGAAVVLGLAVLPVIPLVALAIRLDSAGPVLYSQTRVGLGGRPFRIYKFRTMTQDAERGGAVWAQANDPRTTRVGRFFRLTRIDELPQLWNVLRGDMTLVGPRPERPEFTAVLEQEFPDYAKRHAVKPGLTGWAQVRFRYANCVRSAGTKLEYDLYYIKHASLALDLRILLKTVMVVLRMRGQ